MDAKGLKRPVAQFSVRDKLEAIGRVHAGESKASVARHIGVPESTLRGWCKSEDKLRTVALSCGGEAKDEAKRARHDEPQELDESLLLWLKQQQAAAAVPPPQEPPADKAREGDGWFWRWYKRYGFAQSPVAASPAARLDSALTNNTNNNGNAGDDSDEDLEEDEPPATAAEAVAHGEKFLRWLECCSDPSVTAMQILQFRYLLNNVRACAHRRSQARGHTSRRQ
ncbi:protein distal antenna-like [Bacillus rossius redtenbacheri]|uniref:protein distal antenna-like n=1 Tax=Bacillus rossius redtenbacheri TaxID=93214 RepID=UPI002FDEB2D0